VRSQEIAGDVHSIAWSPSGRNLHALDSHSSTTSATSITNFRIAEDPSLEDIVGIDVLANVSSASQITAHPTESFVYVVTKDSNELVILPLDGDTLANTSTVPKRYKLLPSTLDASLFHTSSLAITASKSTLWTLSQSTSQAVITAFSLATTGEVINIAARASWAGTGEAQLTAAPFKGGDVVAVANSPTGYITILGLDQGALTTVQAADENDRHGYLQQMAASMSKGNGVEAMAAKVKSYGRAALDDYVSLGESVWIDQAVQSIT
jgi:DNA-binding beta-propeller fold protein YncE